MTIRRGALRRLFRLERLHPLVADDVDTEIGTHLEMRYEELVAQGMSPDAARLEARRRFGDIDGTRAAMVALDHEELGQHRRQEWWHSLAQDVRYGVRQLRLSPGFTLIAVVTLALGIGASAAIFSVVHQVLLRPLPFAEQERLVRAWPAHPGRGVAQGPISIPDFDDWRATQHDFAALGAYWYTAENSSVDLTGPGQPERLRSALVTPGFFETLGMRPERGRMPSSQEMAEGGARVVVISDGLWRRRFGGDATIIGRAIVLDQVPHVVVGVMPSTMRFPGDGPEVWLSVLYQPQMSTPWKNRAVRWLDVVGRLAPGVTVDRARRDLAALQRHLAEAYPDADQGWTDAQVTPLLDAVVGDARPPLLILFAAAGCVVLIASANIAALLLTRTSAREREFGVRAALGAPWSRIGRQVLTESLVLTFFGTAAGMLVALVLLPILLRLGADELPRIPAAGIDLTVVVFALGVAGISWLMLGVPPVLQIWSTSALAARRETGGGRGATAGAGGIRTRQALVVIEVGMAVVLVCGAGLMAKSFQRLMATDGGFRPAHILAVRFSLPHSGLTDQQAARYYETVLERVRQVPGVSSAGAAKLLPLQGDEETWPFGVAGEANPPLSQRPTVTVNHISADYFRTIGTPVIAGREFTSADTGKAPDVLIVNEVFARHYLPGPIADVPGRSLVLGDTGRVRIVGVVGSIHESSLAVPPTPAIYVPATQNVRSAVTLVVRTQSDPTTLARAVQRAIWSVNKDQTIANVTTLDDVVHQAVARPRLLSVLLVSFAALGLLLGALGIYGVVAYSVNARRKEIGVRVALGATRRDVLALVVGRGLTLALAGVLIGVAVSLLVTRVLRSVLFGIAPSDPATYGEVIAGLTAVAIAAAYLPARQATRVDATEALRNT